MKESANTEKVTDAVFIRSLIASAIGIIVCMLCFVGTTWAWYSSSAESGENVTVGANFDIRVESDETVLTDGRVYSFSGGDHTVRLTASGTAANGFCQIIATKDGDSSGTTYYIADMTEKKTAEFKVIGVGTLRITPMLGKAPAEFTAIPADGIELFMPAPPAPDLNDMHPTGEEAPEKDTGKTTEIPEKAPEAPGDAAA